MHRFRSYLRRTEGKFTLTAAALLLLTLITATTGVTQISTRQDLLDEAVDRRGALTAAALDVYRTLADADAAALNAVLVDTTQAVPLERRFRDDVFRATDALRQAAALGPGGTSAEHVRELTDLLPEYVRLVEVGWTNSRNKQPVGTSYLAQASYLVQHDVLDTAKALHQEQSDALADAQRDSASPAWLTYLAVAATLALLVAAHRFLARRTRRRFNVGVVAAAALTAVAGVWLVGAQVVSAGHAEDSAEKLDRVVAPLAQARNLAREADGDEARIVIFPKVGDVEALRDNLAQIAERIREAGENIEPGAGRDPVDKATESLRAWRAQDEPLLQPPPSPPSYEEVTKLITGGEPQRLDDHLTTAVSAHTGISAADTRAARDALSGLDVGFGVVMVLVAAATTAGFWPRVAEYHR